MNAGSPHLHPTPALPDVLQPKQASHLGLLLCASRANMVFMSLEGGSGPQVPLAQKGLQNPLLHALEE